MDGCLSSPNNKDDLELLSYLQDTASVVVRGDQLKAMSLKVSDLETDARRTASTRDPPGQRSVYILPGPPERETYRLSTFKDFPTHVQVDPCQLAASSFYFTGYQDRVKCFSCGQAVDSWVVGDEPKSPKWHQPGCGMVNGTDTNNIPVFSMVRNAALSSPSFGSTNNLTTDQRRNTQNISHQTHQDNTSGTRQQGVPSPENFSSAPTTLVCNSTSKRPCAPQQIGDSVFPCRDPISPHMRRMEARLQTFSDYRVARSFFNIRATPEEIADAGMYCLGERDRAKCWYCNGGLQNWEFDDDPWIEHTKWFPMCEYVLQRKGLDFVHAIFARFPNLNRPSIVNPSTSVSAKDLSNLIQTKSRVYHSPLPLRKVPTHIPIVDPQEEMRKERLSAQHSTPEPVPEIVNSREEPRTRTQKVDEYMRTSELVSQAISMGFEEGGVKGTVKGNFQRHGEGFTSLSDLVDTVLALNLQEGGAGDTETQSQAAVNTAGDPEPSNIDEVQRLQDIRLCKVCRKHRSCMVFIPCGHLASCENCGRNLKKCPLCNELIGERLRCHLNNNNLRHL